MTKASTILPNQQSSIQSVQPPTSSNSSVNLSPVPAKQKKNIVIHLFAGGVAGLVEALSCHPLDTIKVRLQLKGERNAVAKNLANAKGGIAPKINIVVSFMTFYI